MTIDTLPASTAFANWTNTRWRLDDHTEDIDALAVRRKHTEISRVDSRAHAIREPC